LDGISEAQRLASRVRSQDGTGRAAFGLVWRGIESDWAHLEAIEAWVAASRQLELPVEWRKRVGAVGSWRGVSQELQAADEALRPAREALGRLCGDLQLDTVEAFDSPSISEVRIATLGGRLRMWGAQPDRIREWGTWRALSSEAESVQLQPIIERLRDGRLQASGAVDCFEFAYYEALARKAFRQLPELAAFHGRSHDQIVEAFRKLDRERAAAARLEVLAEHASMIPRGSAGVGEVGLLAREWTKRVRHLPLRQLIKRAGSAMQMIKPVWMMSPMSLAQYVEQGSLEFDLVVMDEASQVTPVDALGAIARAKQIVVVGDERQLPPTPFFDRVAGNDEVEEDEEGGEAVDVAAIESILGLCSAQGMPSRILRWHYRSQHESLIAISNLEFYKKLYIVPSATSENLGLSLTKVNGTYDRGRARVNRIEARAVAEAVLAHARKFGTSARYPEGMSLGVGAFSVAQRDAILDELEVLRRRDPSTEAFFSTGTAEPFFVKNLESIQGDERDVIFISIGYGKDESGYMNMGFGPLSTQGGERRLNVLISRARRRCQVFSSITADDVDLARASGTGVRVLKSFLRYAETGVLDQTIIGARPPDSDFEEDVGMALAGLGYEVEHQVGVAGFWIDLAVRDPHRRGAYLLGIECDGATYHSSRSARDRDRIREQVLRDRGWRIHRIWSTDWFNSRHQELGRLVAAIAAAGQASPPAREGAASSVGEPTATQPVILAEGSEPTGRTSPKYTEADFRESGAQEPHEMPLSRRCDIIVRIVEVEGVVHQEEIARRFATVCGKQRAGGRISQAVQDGLVYAVRNSRLVCEGAFFSLRKMSSCPARDRSEVRSTTLRNPEMLPPIEIQSAILAVVEDHVSVFAGEAITAATRLFGFQRAGAGLQQAFETQLRQLLADGLLTIRNGDRIYRAG
jgi:very-short-patch-repair endonuclease